MERAEKGQEVNDARLEIKNENIPDDYTISLQDEYGLDLKTLRLTTVGDTKLKYKMQASIPLNEDGSIPDNCQAGKPAYINQSLYEITELHVNLYRSFICIELTKSINITPDPKDLPS